jgi:hypothetical protein
MNSSLTQLFLPSAEKIVGYLPNLFAGLILIGIGWFVGWLVKRVVFQICLLLKLDRVFHRFQWGRALAKADVRYAVYNSVGSVGFFAAFVIFLHSALSVMELTVLSDLLEGAVFFLPRLLIALTIFISGGLIAGWVGGIIQRALIKEEVPRATLVARFSKMIMLIFFSAMALTELNVAREIVIIGFTTIIITLGVLLIVITAGGGKTLIKMLLKTFHEE